MQCSLHDLVIHFFVIDDYNLYNNEAKLISLLIKLAVHMNNPFVIIYFC